MPLPKEFHESLRKKTNDELAAIVYGLDEYVSEAKDAAQNELVRRGMPIDSFDDFAKKATQVAVESNLRRHVSLSWSERFSCLLIPGIGILAGKEWSKEGYVRKASEAYSYVVLHTIAFSAYHFRHVLFRSY